MTFYDDDPAFTAGDMDLPLADEKAESVLESGRRWSF
jgi:hypothetical protein